MAPRDDWCVRCLGIAVISTGRLMILSCNVFGLEVLVSRLPFMGRKKGSARNSISFKDGTDHCISSARYLPIKQKRKPIESKTGTPTTARVGFEPSLYTIPHAHVSPLAQW